MRQAVASAFVSWSLPVEYRVPPLPQVQCHRALLLLFYRRLAVSPRFLFLTQRVFRRRFEVAPSDHRYHRNFFARCGIKGLTFIAPCGLMLDYTSSGGIASFAVADRPNMREWQFIVFVSEKSSPSVFRPRFACVPLEPDCVPLELDGLFDIILRLTSCGVGRARIAPGARFLGVVTFFNAIPDFLKTAPLLILIVCSVSFTILDVYGLYLLRFLSPVRCITTVGGADKADKSALRPISDSTPGQLSVRPIAAMGVVYSSH